MALERGDFTPPVARVSPPAISFSDAGGDTRATNSAQAPDAYRVMYLPVDRKGMLLFWFN